MIMPFRFAAIALAFVLSLPAAAQVQVERLHTLQIAEGQFTVGRLIEASDGSLLGVTEQGGADDCGTVFRITPQGAFSVLHHFVGAETGCEPSGGLIRGPESAEVFYGVTGFQGPVPPGATGIDVIRVGTIYRITLDGTVEVLFALPAGDARGPTGRLLLAADGNFYGMTRGQGLQGRLFRFTPQGEFSVLHDFNDSAGTVPYGGLTEGPDGLLYGIAGATIFRISTAGAFEALHTFAPLVGVNNEEGRPGPWDGPMILGPDGNLWGTTVLGGNSGGGSTFRMTPAGAFTAFVAPAFSQNTFIGAGRGGVEAGADGQLYGVRIELSRFDPADGSYTLLPTGGAAIPDEGGPLTRASDGRYYGITRSQVIDGEQRSVIFRLTGVENGNGTPPPNTTPDPFTFIEQTGVALETPVQSASVPITGLEASAPILVAGGEYSIACTASFTSAPGSIAPGQSVCVRHVSADTFDTVTETVLTIGGVQGSFVSITMAEPPPGTTPEPFSFTPVEDVQVSTPVTSDEVPIIGIEAPAPVEIENGSWASSCEGPFSTAAGMLEPGQSVCVQHTSAAECLATVTTTLNIGGVIATFTSTTVDDSVDSDGDGVSDCLDEFPFDPTIATPPLPGGNQLVIEVDDGALSGVAIVDPDDQPNQDGRPEDFDFPWGLTSYSITGIMPGSSVDVTLTFPSALPADAEIWKYSDADGFVPYPFAVIDGATVTLLLTDGGEGDADGIANGEIVDPVGVAVPVSEDAPPARRSSGSSAFGPLALLFLFTLLLWERIYLRSLCRGSEFIRE